MPQSLTLFCRKATIDVFREVVTESLAPFGHLEWTESPEGWPIAIATSSSSQLTLNPLVFCEPGDKLSVMSLGAAAFARKIETDHPAGRELAVEYSLNMQMAVGVVADPKIDPQAGHEDCLFSLASALDGVLFTGSGFLDQHGELIIDVEGKSEYEV